MAEQRRRTGTRLVYPKRNRCLLKAVQESESNTVFTFPARRTQDRYGCFFLVDIRSHLNELNLKLQDKNNSAVDLMTVVHAFQRKLDIFKDLEGECDWG